SGKLILTGQLGEVMKESAQAALTLARNFLGDAFEKSDVHIHVPAGATPKDGPSAGVAMFLSLVSLLSGKPVRPDVAMTGEISLRGLVLPIGGVKEKTVVGRGRGQTGKRVRPDVAMTGEISLRGLVLPIGGVKEKTLAALRAGIKTVMLPQRHEKDLDDVPAEARQKLEFVFLERVEDAVRTAIGELPAPGE